MAGSDPQTGYHTVRVADTSGVHPKASITDDGLVSLTVSDATGIGRPGETGY